MPNLRSKDGHLPFSDYLRERNLTFRRSRPKTLQLNLGKLCNLRCAHCHVNAGPGRREVMAKKTIDKALDWLEGKAIETVDLTGGAPEIIPDFRYLVERIAASDRSRKIIDRCNLTILELPDFDWLAGFLAQHKVEVVASMPCYEAKNVDRQRGEGVFEDSIAGLRRLNAMGYGSDPDLNLNLVYNPIGANLPPEQWELEADYKEALAEHFGISFNRLYTITNMPIARFLADLRRQNRLEDYMSLLVGSFNPLAIEGLMCRDTISVDWEGRVYDCDFNQMLDLPAGGRGDRFLWETEWEDFCGVEIGLGDHCYGCTAGAGSSCGGALDKAVLAGDR